MAKYKMRMFRNEDKSAEGQALRRGPAPAARTGITHVIIGTSLVNGLEGYNVTVFGLFATFIGAQFFPSNDPLISLMLAVGAFSISFLTRPLGALFIGAYADTTGRRKALNLTVWLTALSTGVIALCPSYHTIGITAPILLILSRALEGFAAGGELGAAATFALEAAPPSKRGYVMGWQLAAQAGAILLGAGIGVWMSGSHAPIAPADGGWRVPFLIGLLIVPVGFLIRRLLPEHAMRTTEKRAHAIPVKVIITQHKKAFVLSTLLVAGRSVPFYAIVNYMPSYLQTALHLPAKTGFLASALSAALLVILSPLSGWLSDRVSNLKKLVVIASGLTTLISLPLFWVATHYASHTSFLICIGVVCFALALSAPAGSLLILQAFPRELRASGYAFSYGLSVSLFASTAQLVMTGLLKMTGNPIAPGWYVSAACLMSFIAALCFTPQSQQAEAGTY